MTLRLPANWRTRIEIVVEASKSDWGFSIKFKDGEVPDGFKQRVGSLEISRLGKMNYVESVYLDPHFRSRKLGILLYETALKHLGHIATSYHKAKPGAQRCWNSLVHSYEWEADFFGGYLKVFNRPLDKKRKCHESLYTYRRL